MVSTERWTGRLALMVAHCAGMIDLVALPIWVGTLIESYHFDAQQAGGLATLFLCGAVASSVFFARQLSRLSARVAATLGFALAAIAFGCVFTTSSYWEMAALHVLAGVSASCALTFTHGTIARSARPHRLFAVVGVALGVFAIAFLGGVPNVIASIGGRSLFLIFAGIMGFASLVCLALFPSWQSEAITGAHIDVKLRPLECTVWPCVIGIGSLGLVQAMIFSFLERIGIDRGFGLNAMTGILVALGVINLLPAALAALLERRLPARTVLIVGPIVQATLAFAIAQSTSFIWFAIGAAFFAATMIFTHTFAFGLVAKLDSSGRVLAATPAMLMVGAAIGPILGGTLVKHAGYGSLGFSAITIDIVAVMCFIRIRKQETTLPRIA
ncbi:MFS transporter [Paraburkholderia sp. A2WS-5]|uniref:MFS transporter n=1 Tax=unclassified Paraburkholderia TaxID=2615204 RepID=UPI003B7A11A9